MDSTRFPHGGATTTEVVVIPVTYQFSGVGDPVSLYPRGTMGDAILSLRTTGTGVFVLTLKETWSFLVDFSFNVLPASADASVWITKVSREVDVTTSPATMEITTYLVGTGAADPQAGDKLLGTVTFRRSGTAMLWPAS